MLTNDQNCVLSLMRESLGVSGELCLPESVGALSGIILHNGILLTVYPTVRRSSEEGSDPMKEAEAELRPHYYAALKQSLLQDHEGQLILGRLRSAGFDCIPLKGWEMRKLYPAEAMRQMADLDILARPYEHEKIRKVMEASGYSGNRESSWKHDTFKKNEVTVEMHKRLTDDSGAIRQWEKGLWDRAKCADGHPCELSAEDDYIFHFVHLHKDFMNGSLGLKRIADTWLLQKRPVDLAFVKEKLDAFGMLPFHDHMVKLSRVAMGEAAPDADSEVLLKHAFTHGVYGSGKSYKAGRIAAMGKNVKSGKLRSKLAAVFLPYKRMKAQFPILEKWPVLLPFCWIKRIVRLLKGDMKRNRRMLDYSDITEEDYEETKRFFKAGGIEE